MTSLLPAGTRVIEITGASATAETPGGIGILELSIGDAWDPALAGRFEFLAGRAPANAHEAMVSPGALGRLDAQLGDTVTLTDPRAEFTIVGVLKSATLPDSAQTLFVPAGTGLDAAEGMRTWFTPDWQPTADQVPELNHNGRDRVRPRPRHSSVAQCRRRLDQSGRSSRSLPRSVRTSWCCWRAPRSRSALVGSSGRSPSQPASAHRAAPCSASCCCRAPSSASSEVSSAPPRGSGSPRSRWPSSTTATR